MNASIKYLIPLMLASFGFVSTSAGASKAFWKSSENRPSQQQASRTSNASNARVAANRQLQGSQQQEPKKRKGLFGGLFGERKSADRRSRSRTVSSNTNTNSTPERYRSNRDATPAPAAEEPKKRGLFAGMFRAQERDRRTSTRTSRSSQTTTRTYVPAIEYRQTVLAQSNRSNTRLVIDISRQKAFLLVDEKVGLSTDISSARTGKYTPRGSFTVTERVRAGKISTLYHVAMPYWQRLNSTVYGVHAGYLPGYPASAGCIRLPSEAAQVIFDNMRSGATVTILDSWGDV